MTGNRPGPPAEMVGWPEVEKLLRAAGIELTSGVLKVVIDLDSATMTVTRLRLNEAGFKTGKPYGEHLTETFEVLVTR